MMLAVQLNAISAENDWATPMVIILIIVALVAAVLAGTRAHRRPYTGGRFVNTAAQLQEGAEASVAIAPGSRQLQRLEGLLIFALAGYLFFDRAFAWVHVPGTPAFVGELVVLFGLYAMLATNTRLGEVARHSSALKLLIAYMAWGAVLLALAVSTYGLDAIRDAALWYYGIVAIFVIVLARSRPARINRWLRLFGRAIPYFLLWFPIAIVIDALFQNSVPLVPDSFVPITSHRVGNMAVVAAVALGFLWLVDTENEVYSERQRVGLTALATTVILFSGMKNRGGFLAAAVALAIAMVLMRRRRSEVSMIMVGAVVMLLAVGLLGNVKIGLFDDNREVSVEQLLMNLSSIVDSNSGGSRQTETVSWRLEIWGQVLDDVATEFPFTGFGPGPDLGERFNIRSDENQPLRNPHNSHVGILARSGFVGVALWAVMWMLWIAEVLLVRARMTARGRMLEAGILGWLLVSAVAILVNAIFDPTLEGPQVAWWLWGILGLGISIVVLERSDRLPDLTLGSSQKTRSRVASTAAVGGGNG